MRLLVASPDRSYAGALTAALQAEGIEVVGHANGDAELVSLLDLDPDAILFAALDEVAVDLIAQCASRAPVLVLGQEDEEMMIAVLEAGALGYADQDASFTEVAEAVRSVVEKRAVVPPIMLGALLRHVVRRRRDERAARAQLDVLTPRELQVFELVARGLDRQAIASTLFISPETVRTHIQNMMRKLGLHSQVEIVALAARCGWEIGEADV